MSKVASAHDDGREGRSTLDDKKTVAAAEVPTVTPFQVLQQEEMTDRVRKSQVDWTRLRTTSILSDAEVELLSRYDRAGATEKAMVLSGTDGPTLVGLMLRVLKLSPQSKVELLYYVLTMLHDIVAVEDPAVARARHGLFAATARADASFPYGPFVRLMNASESAERDDYIVYRSTGVVSRLIDGDVALSEEEAGFFVKWCSSYLSKLFDVKTQYAAVSLLQKLLTRPALRELFWHNASGYDFLVRLISSDTRPIQIVYQATFCVWMLSFSPAIATQMDSRQPLVPSLVEVLRSTSKDYEKVFRVVLATLANLCSKGNLNSSLVNSGYLRVHPLLIARTWKDADIATHLEALGEALRSFESDESTFGLYREEVLSETLKMSAVHESDAFWRQNVDKFAWEDYRLLRVLVHLLTSGGRPSEVLQVACWDLGEFVRVHPNGKRIIETLGGKLALMSLMEAEDVDVQAAALVAMQKIMVKQVDALARRG